MASQKTKDVRKHIPAKRVKDVEALLRRTLICVGSMALASKLKVYPFQVARWEQELAECLEELNDMQVTPVCDSTEGETDG